jgi:hypothetical protein
MPWNDKSGYAHSWEAIRISGLQGVAKGDELWETGRQGVKAGLESVRLDRVAVGGCRLIIQMTQPSSPPLLLIIMPSKSHRRRDIDSVLSSTEFEEVVAEFEAESLLEEELEQELEEELEGDWSDDYAYTQETDQSSTSYAASNQSLADACYKSNETCTAATNCFNRGVCGLKSKTGEAEGEGECWGCRCANGYAGVECQKNDYTV